MFKIAVVASLLVAAVSAQFPQQQYPQQQFPQQQYPQQQFPQQQYYQQQYSQQAKYLQQVPILKYSSNLLPDGRFQYAYETGNGIAAQVVGDQKPSRDGPVQSIQGEYSYTADDGTPVKISYIADENGYQPVGNVLPTPPPIPEAILRSLEFNARTNPGSF